LSNIELFRRLRRRTNGARDWRFPAKVCYQASAIAGLTKTCRDAVTRRDAVTVNDPASDALSGPILCWVAAALGHRRVKAY